jgi:hypothetical protein
MVADTVTGTSGTTCWWTCPVCGVDAELVGGDLAGYEMPCLDCGAAMTEWLRWDTAVVGPQSWDRAAGRSAA